MGGKVTRPFDYIELGWPPAVNNLYMNVGKRRVRTRRYDAWLKASALQVLEQRPAPVPGRFKFSMLCFPPDRRARDLDGLAKAPLDLLVKAGVIEDDSLTKEIRLFWSERPPVKPGLVRIWLEAA